MEWNDHFHLFNFTSIISYIKLFFWYNHNIKKRKMYININDFYQTNQKCIQLYLAVGYSLFSSELRVSTLGVNTFSIFGSFEFLKPFVRNH